MPHSIADRAVFSATPVLTLRRDRNRFTDLLLLLVALSTLIVTTMRLAPAIDEDFWWHLRTGQWILSHHAVPIKDMFSARAAGQPWIDYSWLFDVLTAKIFEAWGYRGMLGMTTLLSLASTAWLTVFLARYVNLRRAMILSFSAYLALLPLKSPRPWLLTILFFIVELSLLSLARERRHPAWLLPIVPLFALWANLHIQFVYGLGLVGLFALEQSLPARPSHPLARRYLWTLLTASCLATLLNPYGWNLYRVVLQYATQSAPLSYVSEMQAIPFRNFTNWIALLLIGAAIFVLGAARRVLGAARRKDLLLISLLAAACFFGFRSQRDIWFPVIVAVIAIATAMQAPASVSQARSRFTYAAIPLSFAIALLFLSLNNQFSSPELHKAVTTHFPEKAAAYVESHALEGPLFNSYNWGGYLIWRLPTLPVSIDGRANLYEASLASSARTVSGQKDWARDPDLRKARTIILEQDGALASILRSDARFHLLYEDDVASVFQPVGHTPAP